MLELSNNYGVTIRQQKCLNKNESNILQYFHLAMKSQLVVNHKSIGTIKQMAMVVFEKCIGQLAKFAVLRSAFCMNQNNTRIKLYKNYN